MYNLSMRWVIFGLVVVIVFKMFVLKKWRRLVWGTGWADFEVIKQLANASTTTLHLY